MNYISNHAAYNRDVCYYFSLQSDMHLHLLDNKTAENALKGGTQHISRD